MSDKSRKRSRRTAKDNGTRMESAVESYLQWALGDLRIQRLRLHGSKDVGDIVEGYENCADRVAFIITSGDSYGIAKGIMSEAIETIKVVTA